jgi:hypothetical protein
MAVCNCHSCRFVIPVLTDLLWRSYLHLVLSPRANFPLEDAITRVLEDLHRNTQEVGKVA